MSALREEFWIRHAHHLPCRQLERSLMPWLMRRCLYLHWLERHPLWRRLCVQRKVKLWLCPGFCPLGLQWQRRKRKHTLLCHSGQHSWGKGTCVRRLLARPPSGWPGPHGQKKYGSSGAFAFHAASTCFTDSWSTSCARDLYFARCCRKHEGVAGGRAGPRPLQMCDLHA